MSLGFQVINLISDVKIIAILKSIKDLKNLSEEPYVNNVRSFVKNEISSEISGKKFYELINLLEKNKFITIFNPVGDKKTYYNITKRGNKLLNIYEKTLKKINKLLK